MSIKTKFTIKDFEPNHSIKAIEVFDQPIGSIWRGSFKGSYTDGYDEMKITTAYYLVLTKNMVIIKPDGSEKITFRTKEEATDSPNSEAFWILENRRFSLVTGHPGIDINLSFTND